MSFVWGEWTILDEDRPAQKRREPYWTLIEPCGYGGMILTHGPIGRKAMEPEAIIWAEGFDSDGLGCKEEDMAMIVNALNAYKNNQ